MLVAWFVCLAVLGTAYTVYSNITFDTDSTGVLVKRYATVIYVDLITSLVSQYVEIWDSVDSLVSALWTY